MKRMNLRYAGVCRECGDDLPARVRAVYDRSTKTVLCLPCADTIPPAPTSVAIDPVDDATPQPDSELVPRPAAVSPPTQLNAGAIPLTPGDTAPLHPKAPTPSAIPGQTTRSDAVNPAAPADAEKTSPQTAVMPETAPLTAPTPEAPPELVLAHREGVPGLSARREHERRKAARENRVRSRHPKIGGLILALSDEPQSTKAWAVGSVGEEKLGRRLDSLAGTLVRVLHDRGIPGSRANIDHIVICPTGIFIIDAKRYKGRPERRTEGGLFSPRVEKLFVGKRDRTKLVDGVLKQTDLVRDALGDPDIPLKGVLCFVEADWPMFGGDFHIRRVHVSWPKRLAALLSRPGPLTESQIDQLQIRVSAAFPAA